jgi:hypothetical protein
VWRKQSGATAAQWRHRQPGPVGRVGRRVAGWAWRRPVGLGSPTAGRGVHARRASGRAANGLVQLRPMWPTAGAGVGANTQGGANDRWVRAMNDALPGAARRAISSSPAAVAASPEGGGISALHEGSPLAWGFQRRCNKAFCRSADGRLHGHAWGGPARLGCSRAVARRAGAPRPVGSQRDGRCATGRQKAAAAGRSPRGGGSRRRRDRPADRGGTRHNATKLDKLRGSGPSEASSAAASASRSRAGCRGGGNSGRRTRETHRRQR